MSSSDERTAVRITYAHERSRLASPMYCQELSLYLEVLLASSRSRDPRMLHNCIQDAYVDIVRGMIMRRTTNIQQTDSSNPAAVLMGLNVRWCDKTSGQSSTGAD